MRWVRLTASCLRDVATPAGMLAAVLAVVLACIVAGIPGGTAGTPRSPPVAEGSSSPMSSPSCSSSSSSSSSSCLRLSEQEDQGKEHTPGPTSNSARRPHAMPTPTTSAPAAADMSVTQIKEELKVKFDIVDTSECIEKTDLIKRLEDSRLNNAEVVTGPYQYGELLRIGNRVNPTGIVTLSHGLGDSARGWEDVAKDLATQHSHLLFLLPTAPQMPVTINMGNVMNAWYDIKSLGGSDHDPNILLTANYVTTLARQVANRYRIPTNRILFGGFSQGAALSLVSALTAPYRPAAVMLLSGYFAAAEHVIPRITNQDLPILMCHGTMDNVLPLKLAEMSKAKLLELGYKQMDFHTFPMAHSAHPRELKLVSEFIGRHIPASSNL